MTDMTGSTEFIRYFTIAYLLWNVAVCVIYGIDKKKSVAGAWRIPERTLILLAFLMGGIGAFAGMKIFHHKTLHKKFTVGVPLCIVFNILVLFVIFFPEQAGALLGKASQKVSRPE